MVEKKKRKHCSGAFPEQVTLRVIFNFELRWVLWTGYICAGWDVQIVPVGLLSWFCSELGWLCVCTAQQQGCLPREMITFTCCWRPITAEVRTNQLTWPSAFQDLIIRFPGWFEFLLAPHLTQFAKPLMWGLPPGWSRELVCQHLVTVTRFPQQPKRSFTFCFGSPAF